MTALAAKLAGLKRQAGAVAPAKPVEAAAPDHAKQLAHLRKLLGLRPQVAATVTSLDRTLDGTEIAPGLRYLEQWVPFGRQPDTLQLVALGMDAVDRDRVLAFDTETTGLAGGTGTRAFMIGAADWHDGGLRIRQLLLTRLAAESAMLAEFARWLHADTVLLSYNGKSYDRPLLSTRYTLARLPDPLRERAHIDLLHPVRRRYRGRWENCRLATVERCLLGIVREDDLPGSEAPAAWLSYLRGGSAGKLRRVGHHNAQDLRSLCLLLGHFAE
ncbi:MAG: ribonuclease H-like domain-containing protein [Luteimonas sp.]|nr:ribonuclease H-like domain-containing protein [Luteimonas sp.]